MGFFQRIKELTHLKDAIYAEQQKLYQLQANYSYQLEILEKNKASKEKELELLDSQLADRNKTMQNIRDILEAENTMKRNTIILAAEEDALKIKEEASANLEALLKSIDKYNYELEDLKNEHSSLQKEISRYKNQARKFKSELVGIKEFHNEYANSISCNADSLSRIIAEVDNFLAEDGLLDTIIKLPLHSDNSKELRKLSTATKKEIDTVLTNYASRYTTKSNQTIYKLMIIGMQAEMQLLLYQLSYQKIDETKENVEQILTKYLIIASEGNKAILPTITRFISEIKPLYLELVEIEYRYYVKRQQEKEEQQAIREQMKQEAEERKALEAERKKLEKEESKYVTEIERNRELLESETDTKKIAQLEERLAELQNQLEKVEEKKEEVTSLAMGKAGYVYVISNLGSFGENIFKIGMTRRLEPQQRVDELGSASVPFKFDVHAMIFSDDAVGLENTLHKKLAASRVNKVNFRKEFFKSNVESLENLVAEIDPTAEFTKTMIAEEYQQTIAIEKNQEILAG
ncbi:hypothetical protein IGI96_000947 [Enterococcus sp. DIV0421]|uniref:GIY-YIG nuclease family protein n=1 Tax=Enterococcus sp. DIV0421 TaxID=2774688 RepID=UPI003F27F182